MNPVPPTSAKFFLSDDVRDEANGKMTILGLFADDRIFLNPLPAGFSLPPGAVGVVGQLCLTCVMFGGSGSIALTAEVTDPNGRTLANVTSSQDFKLNTTSSLAIKGVNLVITAFGTYRCEVKAQGKRFPYTFELLPGPAPAVAVPPVALAGPAVAAAAVIQRPNRRPPRRHK